MKRQKLVVLIIAVLVLFVPMLKTVNGFAQKNEFSAAFTGFEYESSSFPQELTVGDKGQIKRPSDHHLAKTQYSFDIDVYDSSILKVNEKGEWEALKPGKTKVQLKLADMQKKDSFLRELNELGISKKWAIQEIAMEPFEITVRSNQQDQGIPVYRAYNPNTGQHHYTISGGEYSHLMHVGWNGEGIGWYAPATGEDLYRLYNPNTGDHHYTTSVAERDFVIRAGWKYEGVTSKSAGTVPVYRVYNPNARVGTHHYTTSAYEKDFLIRLGWLDEGIGWYAEN